MYHTIIIGAGPSGLMAAYSASKDGKSVLLIEKKIDNMKAAISDSKFLHI